MIKDLSRLFKPRAAVTAGKALYARVVDQARTPYFYSHLGVADTPEGRFELYTLHTVLLVLRLKGRGARSAETVQALFDAYLEGLDIALREMGIGDVSMGKKMKKLGRAFYGRVGNWERALAAPDTDELSALIARTLYESTPQADTAPLAAYAQQAAANLTSQSDETLLQGFVDWPKVPS